MRGAAASTEYSAARTDLLTEILGKPATSSRGNLHYAYKSAPQMQAIEQMVDRLTQARDRP